MAKKQFIVSNIDSKGKIDNYEYLSSSLYEEKKSKFYAYIFEVNNMDEVNSILEGLRKNFKDARHIVYAYVLENKYYCSDDGEPSGTGGKAIYALLEKQKVINTLVVVIRYFGGILLGVGPLSRAYQKAVLLAEEKLDLISYIPKLNLRIKFEYSDEPKVRNIIDKTDAEIVSTNYDEKVIYNINIKETDKDLFSSYKEC